MHLLDSTARFFFGIRRDFTLVVGRELLSLKTNSTIYFLSCTSFNGANFAAFANNFQLVVSSLPPSTFDSCKCCIRALSVNKFLI
jgi:hypothetical protein